MGTYTYCITTYTEVRRDSGEASSTARRGRLSSLWRWVSWGRSDMVGRGAKSASSSPDFARGLVSAWVFKLFGAIVLKAQRTQSGTSPEKNTFLFSPLQRAWSEVTYPGPIGPYLIDPCLGGIHVTPSTYWIAEETRNDSDALSSAEVWSEAIKRTNLWEALEQKAFTY